MPLLRLATMVDMDAAMVVMVDMEVMDMERGLLMLRQDTMVVMDAAMVVMEVMVDMDMERGLLMLRL